MVDIFRVGFTSNDGVCGDARKRTAYGRDSLSARMNAYREVWIRRMLDREARHGDMQIMASLQTARRSSHPPRCWPSAARWRCCAPPAK